MEIESRRPADPLRRDASRSARGSSSKATGSSNCSPAARRRRTLSSGATLPITQTSDPVQLDQVLDALNTDTRANLQNFLIDYGDGAHAQAERRRKRRTGPRSARPERRAGAQQGLPARARRRCAARAIVNQAITGTEPHDLSKLVASIGKVTAALNVHEQQLGELIGNFNTFFRSFAAQSAEPARDRRRAAELAAAIDRGFAALDAALPPTRTFALDIIPGVKRRPRRSPRRCPGSNRCRPRWRRASSAASPRAWPQRRRRSRSLQSRTDPLLQADRTCSTNA